MTGKIFLRFEHPLFETKYYNGQENAKLVMEKSEKVRDFLNSDFVTTL